MPLLGENAVHKIPMTGLDNPQYLEAKQNMALIESRSVQSRDTAQRRSEVSAFVLKLAICR
jgi:hypothetical protein